jgi:pimeloyl-ACP methyl ester carboxylesterase
MARCSGGETRRAVRLIAAGLLAWRVLSDVGVAADDTPALAFRQLDADSRRAIDAAALGSYEVQKPGPPARPFYANLTGWALVRSPLPEGEVLRRAAAHHTEVRRQMELLAPPGSAQELLDRLAAELPASHAGREFELVIVERPEWLSWTAGGPQVYVSRPYFESLTRDPAGADARLAFVLAHELGHVVRGHCRRAYLLMTLSEEIDGRIDGIDRDEIRRAARESARTVHGMVQLLYSPGQEYQSDLFALHLVRNAGLNLEDALDALRPLVAVQGEAGSEPAHIGGPIALGAAVRLARLRRELDGTFAVERYGLYVLEAAGRAKGTWRLLSDGERVAGDEPPVVLIHGMESDPRTWNPLVEELLSDTEFAGRPFVSMHYPGDGSLTQAAHALTRELAEHVPQAGAADYIGHSAGGLIFRYYAEMLGGGFHRAVLVGVPNRGSDMAALRPLVELLQFFKEVKLGYSEAMQRTILDGEEQIGFDLAPGSLFLKYLDGGEPRAERYVVLRGQAGGPLAQIGFKVAQAELHHHLDRLASRNPRQGEFSEFIKRVVFPNEVIDGDLVVTLHSAALPGADRVETVPTWHNNLIHHPNAVRVLAELVSDAASDGD